MYYGEYFYLLQYTSVLDVFSSKIIILPFNILKM